ncbi:MAG: glutamate synthase subunit beta [Polyangiaceae bacterium]|nr:glutamate synthase subunit beta [Polyangiaceae bacterium]
MGNPRGFIELQRRTPKKRPVTERVQDYRECEPVLEGDKLVEQASRCMDCGIPFCHSGCPLGNLIPEWNDLVYRGRVEEALDRLHGTNNFPEFTGRLCPAPCEAACVLAIHDEPVTIKAVEAAIADQIAEHGPPPHQHAARRTGRRVAVIGSGPAGLACAQELAREGHDVVVFEKADAPGGLLRYGIPDFKMDKALLERRIDQMRAEGVRFECNVSVGHDLSALELESSFDAIALALGAENPRKLGVPGEDLAGVHFAMEYLTQQNRLVAGHAVAPSDRISAEGKHVIILGGGDTGADCLGTAHRQGARSVTQLEIAERPPESRRDDNPWPLWPLIFRVSPAHEEGGDRAFGVMTTRLQGSAGRVERLVASKATLEGGRFVPLAGTDMVLPAELVLIAAGFTGPEPSALVRELRLDVDPSGRILADERGRTKQPHVFACGDARRGASLVVWAIAEGRHTARSISLYLAGKRTLALAAG